MPKKTLDRETQLRMESALRDLMTLYPSTDNPILRAKIRSKVKRTMDEFDVMPFGYRGLPEYMKE